MNELKDEFPRLRNLEAFPHNEGGKQLILLRDPSHLAEGMLVVAPEIFSILPLLNGENSLLDIQAELTRRQGQIVFKEHIEGLLEQLDKARFLDNRNFRQHRDTVMSDFREAKIRPAFHAGISYPAEAGDLLEFINDLYTGDGGAGLTGPVQQNRLRALVAPHIDLRLGGPAYTHAYRELGEAEEPDLFVILGTGHAGLPDLFSISDKDFETPLGTASVDKEFLQALKQELGTADFPEDFSHRSEHTIEFQLLFLQHLYRNRMLNILPILVSFSLQDLQDSVRLELFRTFVKGLATVERRTGKTVCYIASVDLAHIGPRYGDSLWPDQDLIDDTSKKDHEMLEYVTACDPEGFSEYIRSENDSRRICGYPPLMTILHLIKGTEGRLLYHGYAQMDETNSFVTFASLTF